MSDEENTPGPSDDANTDDIGTPERTAEEILDDAVKLAGVAITVAQEAVAKVEEAAESSDMDPDDIEKARQQANEALKGAQDALIVAQDQAGEKEHHHKPTLDELAKSAGEIVDRLERRAKYEAEQAEKEEEAARRNEELKAAEEERKQREIQEAEEEKARKEAEAEAEAKEKEEAEAREKAEAERKELASTPEGRAELIKQRKIEVAAINDGKEDRLEIVKKGLKPRYSELQSSLTTLFMLPHLRPIHLVRKNDQDEPKLMCYYGSLQETKNGYKTDKFRTIITAGTEDDSYNLEHQAMKPSSNGFAMEVSYDWGDDQYGPQPNPRTDITLEKVLELMHERLDDIEQEHKSMAGGRLLRVGALTAALIAGAVCFEKCEASEIDFEDDENQTSLIINNETRALLPDTFVYQVDDNALENSGAGEEPGF